MTTMGYLLDMKTTDDFASIFAANAVLQETPEPAPDHVRVCEVMRTAIAIVDANTSVMVAADQMWLAEAECLVVMDQGRSVGMLTDRDLIVSCVCRHRRPTRTRVGDVMSLIPASCMTTQSAADALVVMKRFGASWLPVKDEQDMVVGIVGRKDLARVVVHGHVASRN